MIRERAMVQSVPQVYNTTLALKNFCTNVLLRFLNNLDL